MHFFCADITPHCAHRCSGAPVISVPGRLHPIRVEWLPPRDAHGAPLRRASNAAAAALATKTPHSSAPFARLDPSPYLHLLQRIDASVPASQRGDVLAFLPGVAEISAVAAALAPYAASSRRWVILPLHASLPAEAQARVFEAPPPGVRKAILSTNVAETSVTVDGVRFVIDSGRAKLMRHDAAAGGGALREAWVSAAAAAQRAGRAGRTGPGTVYRLYSAEEHAAMPPHTPPEIQRCVNVRTAR
jgi:HrpA-like RNA helicase